MPFVLETFRLDSPIVAYKFLVQKLNLTMADAQRYINKGRVFYEGVALGNNEKNKLLENSVSVLIFRGESLGVPIIYQNDDFIIFNKPPKMLIHPKGRFCHPSLIDEIKSISKQASLIHRIDKETSGIVLVGKHKQAIKELCKIFSKNLATKEYLAVAKGYIKGRNFCINLPLSMQEKGKDLNVRSVYLAQNLNGKILSVKDKNLNFKSAKSEFEILGYLEDNTLLKVRLHTGRTHQIRVHLHSINHAILGDPLYGCDDEFAREYLDGEFIDNANRQILSDDDRIKYFGAKRLMLHSHSLSFAYKDREFYFKCPFEIETNNAKYASNT